MLNEIPTLVHIANFIIFLGRTILLFLAHLNTRNRLMKTVGSGAITHYLGLAFHQQKKKNNHNVFSIFQRVVSGWFIIHCYGFSIEKIIFSRFWFVLFPLVKFCISQQNPGLNEIEYRNVKCRPVVSADVVKLGSMETRRYSSEKQTLTHTVTKT